MGNAWVSLQFSIVKKNVAKSIVWRKPGKLVIILFPYYGYFFPIWFPSCDILHHMENACIFPSISHCTGKCNKTYCVRRNWAVVTHIFPIVWVLFSRSIPILWYTLLHWKCMGFPINFRSTKPVVNSHPMVLFITWEMYRFSNHFPIAWENSAKTIKCARLRKLVPIHFPKYGCFFH